MIQDTALEPLDFTDIIKAGDVVAWGQACAEPLALTSRLMDQRHEIGGFSAFIGISISGTPNPAYTDYVSFMSFCGTGTNRRLASAGKLDIMPVHYSELPAVLQNRVDVLLLQVSEHPNGNRYSLGATCDYLQPLARAARTVVAEINRQAPFTDAEIKAEDIDIIINSDYLPAQVQPPTPTSIEQRIAAQVAELVEDGATLQFGLGAIPECVANLLGNQRDLGLHTGMMSNAAMELVLSGVITNAHKPFDRGISVTGALLGNRELLAFADSNPALSLRPIEYSHSLEHIAALPKFTAINSAIEIDLSGQANTEVASGRYVGAVGGAVDFARGARLSQGGLHILALPSTVRMRDGQLVSRIVSRLSGPATIGRSEVGLVVTEYGAADLRGASLDERIRRLSVIADPQFQETLLTESPVNGV